MIGPIRLPSGRPFMLRQKSLNSRREVLGSASRHPVVVNLVCANWINAPACHCGGRDSDDAFSRRGVASIGAPAEWAGLSAVGVGGPEKRPPVADEANRYRKRYA